MVKIFANSNTHDKMKSFEKCLKNAKSELDIEQCEHVFKKLIPNFEKLPVDVLLSEVLPKLEITDLVSICRTSKKMRKACYDHRSSVFLWLKILKRDFGIKLTKEELEKLKLKDKKGFLEVYKDTLLLSHKLKTDKSPEALNEILKYGINNDNMLIFKIGLERGADVNFQDKEGNTALIRAAYDGRTERVKILLKNGAAIDIQDNFGNTALMSASIWNNVDTVKLLLENGAKTDIRNIDGEPELISAAREGFVKIVKLLLKYGADIDIQEDSEGTTALMLAANEGHVEIVKLLLENGAKVNIEDKYGNTALDWADVDIQDDDVKVADYNEIFNLIQKY